MRRSAASISPSANSAAAAALRPGAKVTGMPARVAAATSTLTGPPRATEISSRFGASRITRSVNGAIWTSATRASPSASSSSSSVPLASLTLPTGPKGVCGHGVVWVRNSSRTPGAVSRRAVSSASTKSPGAMKWSPEASTRVGSAVGSVMPGLLPGAGSPP